MIKKLLFAFVLGTAIFSNAQTSVFKEDFENDASVALWKVYDKDGDLSLIHI